MKIKIFNLVEAEVTEKAIHKFIQDKEIIDIQFRPDTQCNNVMVVYE